MDQLIESNLHLLFNWNGIHMFCRDIIPLFLDYLLTNFLYILSMILPKGYFLFLIKDVIFHIFFIILLFNLQHLHPFFYKSSIFLQLVNIDQTQFFILHEFQRYLLCSYILSLILKDEVHTILFFKIKAIFEVIIFPSHLTLLN